MNTKTTSTMSTREEPLTAEQQRELAYIYEQTYSDVLNHVRRTLLNYKDDVENVTMDVYIKIQKLIRKPETSFDETKSSLKTWVFTVTNSVILDFFRTNHQDRYKAVSDFQDKEVEDKSYFDFVASERYDADQRIKDAELQKRIAKAFRTIKPHYRKVAILFYLREKSYPEISEILNIPMGSVKGMLNRARNVLQAELKGMYDLNSVNVQTA